LLIDAILEDQKKLEIIIVNPNLNLDLLANIGPESGTTEAIANFSHELFFTLDLYNQKSRKNISARVAIHCDFIPVTLSTDTIALKDQLNSMVNTCYILVLI
jgi:hypothetical protein